MWLTDTGTLFWAQLNHLFLVMIPLTWLAFVFQYTEKKSWLAPKRFWPFAAIPALTLLLALTHSRHRLIWSMVTFQPVGEMLTMRVSYGPWFWVHVFYS